MARRLPTLKSLQSRLRGLISTRGSIGMLHFYLERRGTQHSHERLARSVEAALLGELRSRFREEDLLARGSDGSEWFVFLASPPRSKQGVTRRDLQEVERRVARDLRTCIRDSMPNVSRADLPPLRSGAAVIERDPSLHLSVQLEEARHEARLHGQVSRLLDDQLSGLNHKIRTPLTTIKGVIEMIRHDPEAARRFLTTLEREVDRIHTLLKAFALVTRVQSGLFDWSMQEVDFRELVGSVAHGLEPLAREFKVALQVHLPRSALLVSGSVEILEEAVRQLVDNAIRHGARGRQVRIALKGTKERVVLQIVDRGPGIPLEDLPHIYQPFYVVGQDPDTRAQGGGLGLCLARGVMDVHGGELECDSLPGQGTTMTMRLPRVAARGARSPRPRVGVLAKP